MERPRVLQEKVFAHLFEAAEIAKFSRVERYGDSARSHTANEYICLEEVREGIELFKCMIRDFEL